MCWRRERGKWVISIIWELFVESWRRMHDFNCRLTPFLQAPRGFSLLTLSQKKFLTQKQTKRKKNNKNYKLSFNQMTYTCSKGRMCVLCDKIIKNCAIEPFQSWKLLLILHWRKGYPLLSQILRPEGTQNMQFHTSVWQRYELTNTTNNPCCVWLMTKPGPALH